MILLQIESRLSFLLVCIVIAILTTLFFGRWQKGLWCYKEGGSEGGREGDFSKIAKKEGKDE